MKVNAEIYALMSLGIDPPRFVIDLSEATFIDSMTLGVLLGAVKRLRPSGGKVGIVCADSHIRRIFEITLLDRVFSLHEDRDGALGFARGGT